jgi:AraC-like DNA-binding protein
MVPETDVYREWQPQSAWRNVVACCWTQQVIQGRVQRVIPDGYADLLIYDTGRVELVGLQDTVALPELPPGTNIHGVRLRPEAVAAAIKSPADELRNLTLPAEVVLGSRQTRDLTHPAGLDAWVRSIKPDERTAFATTQLESMTVAETADRMGLTSRQLLRVFVANVGLTPKSYQRVLRLHRFIAEAEQRPHLATAAIAAGYADQAHLTRELRDLTGLTPGRLLAERTRSA